jgi:hypothetical protein
MVPRNPMIAALVPVT